MKKFTKVVLILTAVFFTAGVALTAVAAAFLNGIPTEMPRDHSVISRIYYSFHDDWKDDFVTPEEAWITPENPAVPSDDYLVASEGPQAHADGPGAFTRPQEELPNIREKFGQWDISSAEEVEFTVQAGTLEIIEGDIPVGTLVLTEFSHELQWREQWEDGAFQLTIRNKDKNGRLPAPKAKAVLVIPRGQLFSKLELQADAGDIAVDQVYAEELEISADAGAVDVTWGDADRLIVDVDTGAVKFSGDVGRVLQAECDIGAVDLELQGKQEDFQYLLSCDLGAMTIGTTEFSAMKMSKTLGDGTESKRAEISCDLGAVTVRFTE